MAQFRKVAASKVAELYDLALNPKKRLFIIAQVIEIIRSFAKSDPEFLVNKGFVSLQPVLKFDRFSFSRSFETIKDFALSHSP